MKPLIARVIPELYDAAAKAAQAWILYHDTPNWDRHKNKLTQRVNGVQVAFDVHETKKGSIVVNYRK